MRKIPEVLVCEDDEDTYELYSEVLASAGYSVRGANNGMDGVETAVRRQPDLIIMDVALPGRNGLEAARLLRADVRTRDIPIIALSGMVQNCFAELAREAGCNVFLTKPCPLSRLLQEVERLLRGRHGPSIMLVEDDDEVRDLLGSLLGEEGFTVATAANGLEALTRLKQLYLPPRLILLDLMMPVMDGWTFRKKQRQEPLLAEIPVVVLSTPSHLTEPAVLGSCSFVPKPIDVPRLLSTVGQVVRARAA